jgi:uncharacterized protein
MATIANAAESHLEFPLDAIAALCRKWHITRLEVFGSALRSDFNTQSDIDLLYTFREDAHVGWNIVCVADDFEHALGRPVDLVSRRAVERSNNWIRRRNILNTTKTLYAE